MPLAIRRLHKWLAAVIGIQALIWTLSGLYMTAVHIDIIHGDHFIRAAEPEPLDAASLLDPIVAARSVPGAESIRLNRLLDRPTYVVTGKNGTLLLDARTGRRLPPPGEAQIRRIAEHWYTGDEKLVSAKLIHDIPGEIRGRAPPLWRVEFGGWNKPTLYFAPATGELLTRRHELWRVFDFLWMMHIMDYETRDNINNPLLRIVSWGALLLALSGAILLLFSFPRRKRRAPR